MRKLIFLLLPFLFIGLELLAQDNALHFDGVNDYLSSSSSTVIPNAEGTWQAWVQKANWADHHDDRLFGNNLPASNPNTFYISLHPAVGLHFRYGNGASYASYMGTKNFAANSWHHLAATWTFNGSIETIKLYVDGVNVSTSSSSTVISATTPLFIGGDASNPKFGPGSMDEIHAICTVARSATEIANNYNLISSAQSNLLALLNFNSNTNAGGSNPAIYTENLNGFTFTLNNFALAGNSSNFITSTKTTITSIEANPLPANSMIVNTTNFATAGDVLTIYGTNLLGATASSVKVGTIAVTSILSNNGNKLVATIPSGASSSPISITTPLGGSAKSVESVTMRTDNVLNFDGVNDFMSKGPPANPLNSNSINGSSGTWEAWVQKSNWMDHHDDRLFGNGIDFTSNGSFYISLHPTAGLHFRYGGTSELGNNFAATNITQGFVANSWYHIAASWLWNGSNTELKLYVDGVLQNTSYAALQLNITDSMYVGGDASNPKFGAGSMEEIRLWNVARSDAEIAGNFSKSNYYAPGLIQYENFNVGTASGSNAAINVLNDEVDYNNADYTLSNFALTGSTSNLIASTRTRITSISNTTGSTGSTLTIYGVNLTGATAPTVQVGGSAVSAIVSNNGTVMVVTLGSGSNGKISVATPMGGLAISNQSFTFQTPEHAMHFDGVNDFIPMTAFDGLFYTNNFTVEAWFNTTSNAANMPIVSKRPICGASVFWNLVVGGGHVYCEIYTATQSSSVTSPLTYNDGLWHHAAFTREGAITLLYVDGILVGSSNVPPVININDSVTNVQIGKSPCGYFNGMIDEVRIWNEARTTVQLVNNKDIALTLPQTNLRSYINFNQGIAGGNNTTLTQIGSSTGSVYSVSGFALNGATSNYVKNTIAATPEISDVSTPICAGNPVIIYGANLSGLLPSQIRIGGTAVLSIVSSSTNQLVVIPNGNVGGAVTINTLWGNAVSDSVVTIAQPSVSAMSSAGLVCIGDAITLYGTGASTYVWSNSVMNGIPFVPVSTTTYTVVGTDVYGCSSSSTINITVQPIPSLSVTGTPVICTGNSSTLNVSGASNYTWLPDNLIGSTQIVSPTSTTTYTVTGTHANGCSATTTTTVTVNPLPSINSISASSNMLCGSGYSSLSVSANLQIQSSNYCVPVLTNGGTSGDFISNFDFNNGAINNTTGDGPGDYNYYSSLNANVVAGNTYSFSVTTGPAYAEGKAIFIDYNCDGDFMDMGEYVWNAASAYGIASGSITIPTSATNGTIRLRVVCKWSGTPLSSQSCNLNGYGEYEDYNLTISGGAANSGTVLWSPSNFLSNSNLSTVNVNSINTTTTYTATVTDGTTNCTSTSTVTIQVNSLPSIGVNGISTICNGNSTTLTASGALTYAWIPGNLSGASQTVTPNTSTTYTVNGTDANGCTSSATKTITVNPAPIINSISAAATTLCQGESTAINIITPCTLFQNFTGSFAPSFWTTTLSSPGYGSVNTANAPTSIDLIYPSGANTSALIDYAIVVPANGIITFAWNHNTAQPYFQSSIYPNFAINNQPALIFNGFDQYNTSGTQVGTQTINVSSGDVLHLIAYNSFGNSFSSSSTTTISNFLFTPTCQNTVTWMPGNLSGEMHTVNPLSTTNYVATVTGSNGCSATDSVLVTVNACNVNLNTTAFLQGYYIGGGMMNTVLFNQGEETNASTTNSDSVTIELHEDVAGYPLVGSFTGLMQTNGNIACSFPPSCMNKLCFIALKHRNAIETWSSDPVLVSYNTNYDFSLAANKAFGDNQIELEPGVWGLYSGDVYHDGAIDAFDYLLLDPDVINGAFGYVTSDITGDGIVDAFDYILLDANIISGIGAVTP
jgi:hypothetical protein